jgi:DNA-binding XRE family transcriptional regulator
MRTLGQLIREARGIKTQEKFAEEFNVSRQTIYLWEKGTFRPPDEALAKMGIKAVYRRAA